MRGFPALLKGVATILRRYNGFFVVFLISHEFIKNIFLSPRYATLFRSQLQPCAGQNCTTM